jgi:23S rRNA (adenine1618-N6)-methyltransferase
MSRRAGSGSRPGSGGTRAASFHPRNRHQGRYDFGRLANACPALAVHLQLTPSGERSIDFSDAEAVRLLNQALLQDQYGIAGWKLPPGYLCPPIPGRADYIHGLADLLAESNEGKRIPKGEGVLALDIGTGASLIYPLLSRAEYGWRFIASDIDEAALASAQAILAANPGLAAGIRLRRQTHPERLFAGVLDAGDRVDLTLCNPPFHGSAREVRESSERKWHKLAQGGARPPASGLNFGGQANELFCRGGEAGFLQRMVAESAAHAAQVLWFSSLVSASSNLPAIRRQLKDVGAQAVREIPMAQGSKRSRFVAWTFLDAPERAHWRERCQASG